MFDKQLKLMIFVRFLNLVSKWLLLAIIKFTTYRKKMNDVIYPDYDIIMFSFKST